MTPRVANPTPAYVRDKIACVLELSRTRNGLKTATKLKRHCQFDVEIHTESYMWREKLE
eukprot:TRINITY_DN17487_c0_g1_i1.p1 TRINITY_DN17487_c0_g1~~TRINITY_DN17487_c0_g1_i1.p1  ORF type:complete len:59 (+),score=4.62 TRINITY_DN17487_c0_g1_i1:179-355(+)